MTIVTTEIITSHLQNFFLVGIYLNVECLHTRPLVHTSVLSPPPPPKVVFFLLTDRNTSDKLVNYLL